MADYTITVSGGTYTGTENISPYRTTSGTLSNVWATVLGSATVQGWMVAGKTVEFIGNIAIGTYLEVVKASITLYFNLATVTSTVTNAAVGAIQIIASNITVMAGHNPKAGINPPNNLGHFIGTGSTPCAIRIANASNCVIDGIDASGFSAGTLWGAYGSSYNTYRNCIEHDSNSSAGGNAVLFTGDGHNIIQDNVFHHMAAPIFVASSSMYNQIIGNEFYALTFSHSIYLDGSGGGGGGWNIVSGNYVHEPGSDGAFVVKCGNNDLHHNVFVNFGSASVPFSIFSQYSGSTANDNDVHHNTFTNVYQAIWLGHGDICLSPTNRNRIHDNIFDTVTQCIELNPSGLDNGPSVNHVDDTKIYYNTFINCGDIFPTTNSNGATLISATVVAYNNFGGTVSNQSIKTYGSSAIPTMVTGNTGMTDFNPIFDPASPYYIAPLSSTPTVSITATTSTNITVGQSVSFTASVTGGTPPYTITWYPIGGTGTPKTITFPSAGTFNVYAVAVDSDSQTSSNSNVIQVTVTAASTPSITINATTSTTITIGQSVSFTASVIGGTPPYTVNWYDQAGNPKGTGTPKSIVFASQGTYYIHAVAVDSASQTSPASNIIQVTVNVTTPTVTIQALTSTSIYVGQSVSFSASISGGVAPYTITWSPIAASGTTPTITFPDAGNYSVYASVVDNIGQTANSNTLQINVSQQPPAQLYLTLTAVPSTVQVNKTSMVTAHVADGSGNAVSGSSVALTSSGGTLTQTTGITDASGNFATIFTDSVIESVTINGNATKQGYNTGIATAITIIVQQQSSHANVNGKVKKNDGTPIAGAVVALDGLNQTTIADGSYSYVDIEAKTYTMTVTASGYEAWSFQLTAVSGQTTTQDAVLTTSTTSLPIVEAAGGAIALIALYYLIK